MPVLGEEGRQGVPEAFERIALSPFSSPRPMDSNSSGAAQIRVRASISSPRSRGSTSAPRPSPSIRTMNLDPSHPRQPVRHRLGYSLWPSLGVRGEHQHVRALVPELDLVKQQPAREVYCFPDSELACLAFQASPVDPVADNDALDRDRFARSCATALISTSTFLLRAEATDRQHS